MAELVRQPRPPAPGPASRLAAALLGALLPATCVGCGEEGSELCDACRPRLDVRLSLPPGIPLGLRAELPLPLAQLEWCAPFSGVVRTALHRLKYGGERRLAAPLGLAVAARWAQAGRGGELLVPVPIHADRAARRGYDQAVLLAVAAADGLELPWLRALDRTRPTTPQFELGRTARLSNVRDAFAPTGPAAVAAIRGRWIVLVDDVATTGATLVACAESLYAAGARAVSAVTVARER